MVAALEARYRPALAEQWDHIGLVLGDPDAAVRRVLCVVDVVDETVAEAFDVGADLIVAHHPLLFKGVTSVAPTTPGGRLVHRLIKGGVALFTAHTNADAANPGVSDALAALFDLADLRPLAPRPDDPALGLGRVGTLPVPLTLAELTRKAADQLPKTAWGVRSAGDPERIIRTLAVCGGSGDSFLARATASGADAYLTADLRHHVASDHLAAGGPSLLDAAHWATERPWCDDVAAWLRAEHPVEVIVSDLDTDPWTLHAASPLSTEQKKEPSS
ncbi:Nif3-like dinuclear metal center hexameric protein [Catenuloplanes sp. NPDC051500]|uniref:Nif3-like dinuclear metal center hexameric protein n=1 Tax=Catenuloplanes sp. NPDC051500 TaxID=3363959 RepID=UPI00379C0CD0